MFSESLKQLIEASLVDGVLTQNERNIIIKRALLEGNDPDEVNLLLDAEIQKIKLKKQASAPKVNKCPACGEILPALSGICPACGYVVNTKDSRNLELDFLIEQMNRGLAQLKSGTANAPMVLATLDEHRRRAMTLYGENPKVQQLLEEIKQETEEFKRVEAERQKADTELKKMEAQAKIQALKGGNSGGGGEYNGILQNKGCQKGCLISFVIFMLIGLIGMCADSDTEEKVDAQFEEYCGKIDKLKEVPITVDNFETKYFAVKDMTWPIVDKYSSYDKARKKAFTKMCNNYMEQLYIFYRTHEDEIVEQYGQPFAFDLTEFAGNKDDGYDETADLDEDEDE
jgi:ribosomal protein L32